MDWHIKTQHYNENLFSFNVRGKPVRQQEEKSSVFEEKIDKKVCNHGFYTVILYYKTSENRH